MKRVQFTLRIADELINKLACIAENNSRTLSGEISKLMREAVIDFESEHGEIEVMDNAV